VLRDIRLCCVPATYVREPATPSIARPAGGFDASSQVAVPRPPAVDLTKHAWRTPLGVRARKRPPAYVRDRVGTCPCVSLTPTGKQATAPETLFLKTCTVFQRASRSTKFMWLSVIHVLTLRFA
jgi:hypothetical protein